MAKDTKKKFLVNQHLTQAGVSNATSMPKINSGVSVRKFNTGEVTHTGVVGHVNGKPVIGNVAANLKYIGKPTKFTILQGTTKASDTLHPQHYPSTTEWAQSRRESVNESISPDKPSKAPVAKGLDFPQQPKREKPKDAAFSQKEHENFVKYNTSRGRKAIRQMEGSKTKIKTKQGEMSVAEALMRKRMDIISKRGETTSTTIGRQLGAVMSEGDQEVKVRYAKNDTSYEVDPGARVVHVDEHGESKHSTITSDTVTIEKKGEKISHSKKQTNTGMTNLLGGGVRIGELHTVKGNVVAKSRALSAKEANNIEIYKKMLDADPKTGEIDLDKPHIVDERQDIKEGEIRLGYSQGTGNAFGSTRVANPARKALEAQGSKIHFSRGVLARDLNAGVKLPGQDEKKAELIRTGKAYEVTKKVNYVPTTEVKPTVPVSSVSNKAQGSHGQFRSEREKLLGAISKLQSRIDSGTATANDIKTLAGLKKKHAL